ncbi:MAG: DNA-3-methyladenine glycosylase I [Flavobacteriaceae bacterium]|nr:DNA-3-methyladenine glycosylase I [Flavobacteriaceae bacterium]
MFMKKNRCSWCGDDPLYIRYHDEEWGVPLYDDQALFECLILETFQAGLSWITVLKKRENFRNAFDRFNYSKIATYDEKKIESLLQNSGIIRNKLKILSAISNAKCFIEIQNEFGSFRKYIWGFVNENSIKNNFKTTSEYPVKTSLSETIGKDLKNRGFKFVGATVVYAFMQAIGIVNDHVESCFRYLDKPNLNSISGHL